MHVGNIGGKNVTSHFVGNTCTAAIIPHILLDLATEYIHLAKGEMI